MKTSLAWYEVRPSFKMAWLAELYVKSRLQLGKMRTKMFLHLSPDREDALLDA